MHKVSTFHVHVLFQQTNHFSVFSMHLFVYYLLFESEIPSTKSVDLTMTEIPSTNERKTVCSEFYSFHTYHEKLS